MNEHIYTFFLSYFMNSHNNLYIILIIFHECTLLKPGGGTIFLIIFHEFTYLYIILSYFMIAHIYNIILIIFHERAYYMYLYIILIIPNLLRNSHIYTLFLIIL